MSTCEIQETGDSDGPRVDPLTSMYSDDKRQDELNFLADLCHSLDDANTAETH
jgi:hypothetical protein